MHLSRVRAPLSPRFSGVGRGAAGGFGGFVSRAVSDAWAWLEQWRARAAERRALAQLTDWELKDIGISRAEADGEAEKWFWRP
jgi:uncharacterized protein YjiS (DUF1127 family)